MDNEPWITTGPIASPTSEQLEAIQSRQIIPLGVSGYSGNSTRKAGIKAILNGETFLEIYHPCIVGARWAWSNGIYLVIVFESKLQISTTYCYGYVPDSTENVSGYGDFARTRYRCFLSGSWGNFPEEEHFFGNYLCSSVPVVLADGYKTRAWQSVWSGLENRWLEPSESYSPLVYIGEKTIQNESGGCFFIDKKATKNGETINIPLDNTGYSWFFNNEFNIELNVDINSITEVQLQVIDSLTVPSDFIEIEDTYFSPYSEDGVITPVSTERTLPQPARLFEVVIDELKISRYHYFTRKYLESGWNRIPFVYDLVNHPQFKNYRILNSQWSGRFQEFAFKKSELPDRCDIPITIDPQYRDTGYFCISFGEYNELMNRFPNLQNRISTTNDLLRILQ